MQSFRPRSSMFFIRVCWSILAVFPCNIKFSVISFISFKASGGVSIILDMYIKGDRARVVILVIFPLIASVLCFQISNQIKSNQILFKDCNVYLKEKKISKKLFTRLYSISNSNKLYIWFKYFGSSFWNRTWPQMKIYFSEF